VGWDKRCCGEGPSPPRSLAESNPKNGRHEADEFVLERAVESPPGLGLRQSSGAFDGHSVFESGRGLPQSKTLSRRFWLLVQSDPFVGRLTCFLKSFRASSRGCYEANDGHLHLI
jgi:hypothetical protein